MTKTEIASQSRKFIIDAMGYGLYRVTLMGADGRMENRRRDVAKGRIESVKAMLLAECAA